MTILERKKRIKEDLINNRKNIILDGIYSGKYNKNHVKNKIKEQIENKFK